MELLPGTLDLLILKALASGARHGLGISRRIEQITGGTFQVKPGSLFPALHRMERRGLIKSRWGESNTGRKRKYYSLKKDGKAAMEKHHEHWTLVHSVLSGLQKEQYV